MKNLTLPQDIYVTLLDINNPYIEETVNLVYSNEFKLNKAYIIVTEALRFRLGLAHKNDIVSSKIMMDGALFYFEKVYFPFVDVDVPCSPSYGVYISQRIRFSRVSSNAGDFINRNNFRLLRC